MQLVVRIASQYGNTVIYPVNDAAKALAEIAGTKTLLLHDIETAALRLGCTVAVQDESHSRPLAQHLLSLPQLGK